MAEFTLLVGLPGSGKSTFAKQFKDYEVLSPDSIRNKYNLHGPETVNEVYDILHKQLRMCLSLGKNVVYDSTNLTKKRRQLVLNIVREYDYHTTCYVMLTSLETCKERNDERKGYAHVTDAEYDTMLSIYNIPLSSEGWDRLIFMINDDKITFKKESQHA